MNQSNIQSGTDLKLHMGITPRRADSSRIKDKINCIGRAQVRLVDWSVGLRVCRLQFDPFLASKAQASSPHHITSSHAHDTKPAEHHPRRSRHGPLHPAERRQACKRPAQAQRARLGRDAEHGAPQEQSRGACRAWRACMACVHGVRACRCTMPIRDPSNHIKAWPATQNPRSGCLFAHHFPMYLCVLCIP